jgi:hypothetical protein
MQNVHGVEIGPPPVTKFNDPDIDPVTHRWVCPNEHEQSNSISRCVHCGAFKPSYATGLRKLTNP